MDYSNSKRDNNHEQRHMLLNPLNILKGFFSHKSILCHTEEKKINGFKTYLLVGLLNYSSFQL
jgi:hypothetical protein